VNHVLVANKQRTTRHFGGLTTSSKAVIAMALLHRKLGFYGRTGEGVCNKASKAQAAVPVVAAALTASAMPFVALAAVAAHLAKCCSSFSRSGCHCC